MAKIATSSVRVKLFISVVPKMSIIPDKSIKEEFNPVPANLSQMLFDLFWCVLCDVIFKCITYTHETCLRLPAI